MLVEIERNNREGPESHDGEKKSTSCLSCSPWFNLVVLCSSLLVSPVWAAEPEKPMRMLFVGSSSIYWNNMPETVAQVVSGAIPGRGKAPADADLVGRSGTDIRMYLDPQFKGCEYGTRKGQTALQKIQEEKFDFVVLQAVCSFIMADEAPAAPDNLHAAAIAKYCEAIRAAGGEPVIYEMGWGKTDAEAQGRQRILDAAKKNRIRLYAPCSSAWAKVYADKPDLKLQHPSDGSHPGDLGHFLNLACFYAAFTRQSPEGKIPRTLQVWPHLTKTEKETRKVELDAAYARFKPTEYQARLPEWMKRNAGAGFVANIDEPTARYLEQVAWETWQEIDRKLATDN